MKKIQTELESNLKKLEELCLVAKGIQNTELSERLVEIQFNIQSLLDGPVSHPELTQEYFDPIVKLLKDMIHRQVDDMDAAYFHHHPERVTHLINSIADIWRIVNRYQSVEQWLSKKS